VFTSTEPLIECVPNFSEGKNIVIINAIGNVIENLPGVKLMHTDIGFDAHRTVSTFAGKPHDVVEAAFEAIKTAQELIDMRKHKGVHPRMGACDVCPLIPLRNISMQEVVELSKILGQRVGELGIPVYLYEYSATSSARKNLTYLRKGEYEEIISKVQLVEWKPDFGPHAFNAQFGMMALGARNFLLAYNINLKTKDVAVAKKIAHLIRTTRERNDDSYESNLFQHVKAIGWWMEEYQCVQVSTNITDINASPVLEVFNAIRNMAKDLGVETNGSELIGLIPEKALINSKMNIDDSIAYLGLNSVDNFNKTDRIIEYNLGLSSYI
jgi:glutamate formiminotransferase/formiminotetrahydrofolate cyclodeaminase